MLGFEVRCNNCGTFIAPGKKLNCRKETVPNKDYLGVPFFRFYFQCPNCFVEVITNTDPQNSGYTVECGAKECYALCRRDVEGEGVEEDRIKALEKRALQLKREVDVDANINELILMKSGQENVSVDAMLDVMKNREKEEKFRQEMDEVIVKSIKFGGSSIRRISDDDDKERGSCRRKAEQWNFNVKLRKVVSKPSVKVSVVKKLVEAPQVDDHLTAGLHLLGQNYGSGDDD